MRLALDLSALTAGDTGVARYADALRVQLQNRHPEITVLPFAVGRGPHARDIEMRRIAATAAPGRANRSPQASVSRVANGKMSRKRSVNRSSLSCANRWLGNPSASITGGSSLRSLRSVQSPALDVSRAVRKCQALAVGTYAVRQPRRRRRHARSTSSL